MVALCFRKILRISFGNQQSSLLSKVIREYLGPFHGGPKFHMFESKRVECNDLQITGF